MSEQSVKYRGEALADHPARGVVIVPTALMASKVDLRNPIWGSAVIYWDDNHEPPIRHLFDRPIYLYNGMKHPDEWANNIIYKLMEWIPATPHSRIVFMFPTIQQITIREAL